MVSSNREVLEAMGVKELANTTTFNNCIRNVLAKVVISFLLNRVQLEKYMA